MAERRRLAGLSLLVLLLVHACATQAVSSEGETPEHAGKEEVKSRQKRGALGFGRQTSCALRKFGWGSWARSFLMYGYGCHCGLGKSVQQKLKSVDDLDKCCEKHDKCYDKVKREKKCWHGAAVPYRLGPCSANGRMECRSKGRCSLAYCKCDQVAAACFRQHFGEYKFSNRRCGKGDFITGLHKGVKSIFRRRSYRRRLIRRRIFRRRSYRRRLIRRRIFRRRSYRRRLIRRRVFRRRVYRRRVFRRRVYRRRVFRRRWG